MSENTPHIKDFIRHLLSATANAALYGMNHPQAVRLTSQAYESLLKALEKNREFSLFIIEGELVIDGQPQEFSLFVNRFSQILSTRGISYIKLIQGVGKQEIAGLIQALACQDSKTSNAISSSEHIRLGQLEVRLGVDKGESGRGDSEAGDQAMASPMRLDDITADELDRFREIYTTVRQHHKLRVNGIFEIVSAFVDTYRQEGRSLLMMASLRESDEYTFTHSTNVSILNIAQATALGIEGQLLNEIGVAGMLHDIGKLFIPEEIITKNGRLTDDEMKLMQTHPLKGARYLLETPGVPRLAIVTAYEHHLKYDLSGYPAVAPGWRQNLCSHITALSDFFDALRTRRSYREPMELGQIAGMMTDMMGNGLHPELTKNFLKIISTLSADQSVGTV